MRLNWRVNSEILLNTKLITLIHSYNCRLSNHECIMYMPLAVMVTIPTPKFRKSGLYIVYFILTIYC